MAFIQEKGLFKSLPKMKYSQNYLLPVTTEARKVLTQHQARSHIVKRQSKSLLSRLFPMNLKSLFQLLRRKAG